MSILLDQHKKLVHVCKTNDALGVGMTKCGYSFLLGDANFIPDERVNPPDPNRQSDFKLCPTCESHTYNMHKNRWKHWKRAMEQTLLMIGVAQSDVERRVKTKSTDTLPRKAAQPTEQNA